MHQSETKKNKGTNKQNLGKGQRAHKVLKEGGRGTEGKRKWVANKLRRRNELQRWQITRKQSDDEKWWQAQRNGTMTEKETHWEYNRDRDMKREQGRAYEKALWSTLGPQCPRGLFLGNSWNLANFDCIISNGRRKKGKGEAAGSERTNNTNNPALPLFLALFAPWHALFLAQHFQVTQRITNCFRFRFLHPQMMLRFRAKCCLYSYLTHVHTYLRPFPRPPLILRLCLMPRFSYPCLVEPFGYWVLRSDLHLFAFCTSWVLLPTFAQMGDLFSILFACYYLATYSL